jgi:hypothetical protein
VDLKELARSRKTYRIRLELKFWESHKSPNPASNLSRGRFLSCKVLKSNGRILQLDTDDRNLFDEKMRRDALVEGLKLDRE